jgi:hypothetical protein
MTRLALVFGLLLSLTASAWATPAQILIIRHGEKPATGDNLSPEGEKRAQALVHYFRTNREVTRYGTPVAIFAMKPSGQDPSNRPVQTITPTAISLGLKIHDKFGRDDIKDVADKILSDPKYDGKMVLICWEHDVIPQLASQLGVSPTPDAWPDDVFDWVYEIDYSGKNVSSFRIFSQHLMPGDKAPSEQ